MAAYPKPLARKTLEKRYQAFAPEKREFLSRFFVAAANLYGVVFLDDLYGAYRDLMKRRKKKQLVDVAYVEGITWDKFEDFSSVLRRDGEMPFFVFESKEFDSEEKEYTGGYVVVHRDMVTRGVLKLKNAYEMIEQQEDKVFYTPVNFLDYDRHVTTPAEKKLKKFLENLKSVALKVPVIISSDLFEAAPYVYNKFKGSYLRNIRSVLRRDEIVIQGMGVEMLTYEDRRRIFNEDGSYRTFAEQMLGMIYDSEQDACYGVADAMELYFSELERMGVDLSGKQTEQLFVLVTEYHNTLPLRSNRGFPPSELSRIIAGKNPGGMPKFVFGNGYKKMIRKGDLNLEDLRQDIFDDENLSLPMKKNILDGLKDLEKDL